MVDVHRISAGSRVGAHEFAPGQVREGCDGALGVPGQVWAGGRGLVSGGHADVGDAQPGAHALAQEVGDEPGYGGAGCLAPGAPAADAALVGVDVAFAFLGRAAGDGPRQLAVGEAGATKPVVQLGVGSAVFGGPSHRVPPCP